jgi:cupin 2 domain-containing protein
VQRLVAGEGVTIEYIRSGVLEAPVEYLQNHDEWVAVLEGSAELEVEGAHVSLTAGDWMLLPRGTPHRLLQTTAGTSWLAVHYLGDDPVRGDYPKSSRSPQIGGQSASELQG